MKPTAAQIEAARLGMPDPNITRRATYTVRVPGAGEVVFERRRCALDDGHEWLEWVVRE